MRPTSDARDDTEDRDSRHDSHDAEPVRSDPWASGPGHLTQDEPTERYVPEQRSADHDSAHDGHLYASDTYAEPETQVLHDQDHGRDHGRDEPTAVGVAHVDTDRDTDRDTDAEAKADEAEAKADEARETAEEARAEARTTDTDDESGRDTAPAGRHEPEVETVALPPAAPVVVVEPVGDRPGDLTAVPVEKPTDADDHRTLGHTDTDTDHTADHTADRVAAGHAGDHTVDHTADHTADLTATDHVAGEHAVAEHAGDHGAEHAGDHAGELKPGDVPVAPVAGFLAADAVQGLRDRWREAQLGFVDDPRKAVDDVKALVSEAVDQFTSALSAQRDELDAAAGEDTEQYRVAVQRYRTFFDRLLDL